MSTASDDTQRAAFYPPFAEAALSAVADSHDRNCSPELRHLAREALGLFDCEPRQDCPFCSKGES